MDTDMTSLTLSTVMSADMADMSILESSALLPLVTVTSASLMDGKPMYHKLYSIPHTDNTDTTHHSTDQSITKLYNVKKRENEPKKVHVLYRNSEILFEKCRFVI